MQRLLFSDLGVPLHLPHTHVTRLVGPRESIAHTHDFYEVFLVLEGSATHHLNGRRNDLAAGHLIAIRPQDTHWFSADEGATLIFVNAAVSTVWWEAFHALFGWPCWSDACRSVVLGEAETRRMGSELGKIYTSSDALGFVKVLQEVRGFLLALQRPTPAAPPEWLETIRQDLALMPDGLSEPISFWQNRSGCSPEHLSRSCRRFYGVTLRELINLARVERAKFLLRTTDSKVISVAFECGFENMANFHRTFSRVTGLTPNGWRKIGNVTVPVGEPASSKAPSSSARASFLKAAPSSAKPRR